MSVVLDTHAALWYLAYSDELSPLARTTIEESIREGRHVFVSAISLVEVVYLTEKRRIPIGALEQLRSTLSAPTSGLTIAIVDRGVADALRAISREAVPDMPDRIVAATALHLGLPLVTRDRRLQAAGIQTIW